MKVYLVVEAIHITNNTSEHDFEDLSTCAKAYSTYEEAEKAVKEFVKRFIDDFNEDGCSEPEELEYDFKCIMASRDHDTWTHEYCDRSGLWRILESNIGEENA